MTKKTRSEIMTKKKRSEIGREASAYFAPNYHLCQNYAENGSFLTVHKSARSSTIVECNRCYLFHPRQATFYTYERDKMTEKELKEAMEATKEFKAYQVLELKRELLLEKIELESQKSLPFYRALLKTPEWRAWTMRKQS